MGYIVSITKVKIYESLFRLDRLLEKFTTTVNEFKEVQLRATETQKACVQRARQNSMLRASNATPASSDTNLIDIRASPSDEDFDPLDGGAKLQRQQQAQQQKQAQIAAGNGNRFEFS